MPDPRFFKASGPFTLGEMARIANAEIRGGVDADTVFRSIAPLDLAGPDDVSFVDNRKYVSAFERTRAGACIVHPELLERAPQGMALLVTEDPYRGYALVAQAFYPMPRPAAKLAENTSVDASARIGEGCRIDEGVVIGANAEIGDNCWIGANTVIGDGVAVGGGSYIAPLVTLLCCKIGERAIIHSGVRIGQDGFGFAMGADGHEKIPQLGRVIIHDDVEIGANTTIDRGAGPDTVIGPGCKIDNLVQIAHNVELGRGCVVVSQVGISGSTKFGDFVVVGGQAGFTGHLSVGNHAKIAAKSGVMRDVAEGASVAGAPAMPISDFWRLTATLVRLAKKGRNG
jgi:UDP-3-O-[3-hydroxymyristoyl] glucosamine N-acyltransferase